MKTGAIGLMWGVAVALGGVHGVAAQQQAAGDGTAALTLQEALERATRFNPEYRQRLNQLDLDSHPGRQWWARFMPRLGLNYSTQFDVDRRPSYLDPRGIPVDNPEPMTIRRSSSSHGAAVSLTVLDGGRRIREIGQNRAEAQRSRVAAEEALNSILAQVQSRYLAAQKQRAQLAIEEALLADRELDAGEKKRRFDLLAIARSDLLAAQLDLERQHVSVSTARGALDKALLALQTAIGDPGLEVVDIERHPPPAFDPSTLDLAELVARARRESPRVASAEAELAVQRATLSSRKAVIWPTISLNTSVGTANYGDDYSQLFGLDFDNSAIGADVRLSFAIPLVDVLPIFDGFQKSYDVASADMSLRNAESSLRQTMLEIEESIRSRYVDLETAWANVRQQEKALGVATERLSIVQEQYLLATVGIEDLRTAIREEATERREEVNRRFEFAEALLALYEEVGIVAREAGIAPPPEGN